MVHELDPSIVFATIYIPFILVDRTSIPKFQQAIIFAVLVAGLGWQQPLLAPPSLSFSLQSPYMSIVKTTSSSSIPFNFFFLISNKNFMSPSLQYPSISVVNMILLDFKHLTHLIHKFLNFFQIANLAKVIDQHIVRDQVQLNALIDHYLIILPDQINFSYLHCPSIKVVKVTPFKTNPFLHMSSNKISATEEATARN